MADSILRLKVDSQEYDQKIKRAAEGIQQYAQKCRDAGGTLQYLDDGVLEFVQALGKMDTVATGTKQQLREMSNALTTLTQTYRGLTDEEKASPFGQELAKGIQQLTERAGQAQDAMADVQASIRNAASDTRLFDQMAQGMSVATAGFQGLTGAGKLLGIEMGNDVEVIAKLQAAMAVTNSLTTIQTALQKQSALMQGVQAAQAALAAAAQTTLATATGSATVAQAAFNAVAKANPYVLLATAIAAVGGALYAFASASSEAKKKEEELAKAEEEAKKKADEQRRSFVNASAEAMNPASRISSLQVAYKNANSEMEKTNILKQAQTEFKKLGIECKGVHDAQTLLIQKGAQVIELIKTQGTVAALSAIRMEKFKESFKMLMENGYSASAAASLAGYNKDVMELDGQITTMQGRIQGLKGSLGVGSSGGSGKGGKTKEEDTNYAADSIMAQEKEVQRLTDAWNRASGAMRDGILKDLDAAKAKLEAMKKGMYDAGQLGEVTVTGSKMTKVNKDFRENGASEAGLSSYIGSLKSAISQEDLGSELYNNLTSKLQDASMMQAVLQQALASGASAVDMAPIAQEIKSKMLEGDIDETAWQEFLDKINEKIQDADLKLTFDVDTKSITTAAEKNKKDTAAMAKEWQAAGSAIQAVGQAMSQIEDPAAKVLGTIAQAVATMALSYAQAANSKAVTSTGWGWIAFAATGLATMISSIAAIKNATAGFANGGIIPGNSYSGDNMRGMTPDGNVFGLNAGEVVLNASQQNNLASQLEGNGMQGYSLETRVNGRDLVIVMNNDGTARGRGELVRTNRRN